MNLFISKIVSSILQIILFAIIPFIWWLVTARKKQSFPQWIGLKKMKWNKNVFIAVASITVAFMFLGMLTLYMLKDVEIATSEFAGLGLPAIPAIVIYATFNTALPEEILFRGFLLKRIQNKFGFGVANVVQAFIFGFVHGVMFWGVVGVVKALVVIIFTGVIAWLMGYINEKKCEGSIIPSWIIHTISNIFAGICAAFSLI